MASQPEPPGRPAREAPCQTAAMGGDAVSMWSAPTRGEDLAALQGLVQQKLGRCLIRLQQYELLIKDFVARARLEGPANSILKIQEARAATVAQQTLGQVVGALLGTVFVEPAWDEDGFPPTAAPSDEGVWINSGVHCVCLRRGVCGCESPHGRPGGPSERAGARVRRAA